MFGVNLINAGFLAAGLAVAVPILIHLLMKPRAQPVSIGTLRFLKLALQQTTKRRKIRRWLLLALRVAAVFLLALLFARPFLSALGGGQGKDSEVIVLIDQSGSMSANSSGRPLFAHAQKTAQNILGELPDGTKVHLAYFDDRSVSPCPENRIDMKRQPGYAGTDFGQALNWAKDIFVTSDRKHRKAYLLTDLQRTGQHSPCKGFPADAEVEVIELGNPPISNLSVEKAEAGQAVIRGKEPIVIGVQVSNSGMMPAHDVPVRLRLESTGVKPIEMTKTVGIAAGATEHIDFAVPIARPGVYQGYAAVAADDGFPTDDLRWLAFEARAADHVLLVDGEPGSSVFGNETYYLETALRLALPGKYSSLTPFEPDRTAIDANTPLPDLMPYQAVALCNVAAFADGDIRRLRSYVDAGGRLLICTGGKIDPKNYATLGQAGLLPCTIGSASDAGWFRIGSWEKNHPIFRPLSDPQEGDLRRLSFRKITKVKPTEDAKILAADTKGNPLLLEKSQGSGKVLLFATSADRDWSDWPQARLFVPIVHQIFGYMTDRLPENQRIRPEIAGPGIDKPPGIVFEKSAVVVRNLDPGESRIERYSQRQFRDEFQLADMKVDNSRQSLAAAVSLGAEQPNEIWTVVIWILLAVLALELFLANRTHA